MSGQSSTFRKVSLDRLSSPEQLDQKLTVVSPIGWAALISVALLVSAALAWGFFGSISNKVNGSGVLLYGEGIAALTAQTGGQITDISVREGDSVEKGQVVARFSQEELIREIEQCRENLSALDAISAETLGLDIDSLNSEIYPEFAQIANQIRLARVQYESQKNEASKGEQDVANQRSLQAQQISALKNQIADLEEQIAQYEKLIGYQREVELENAEAQDNQRAQSSGGALVVNERGNYFRRSYRAAYQLMVLDQVGNAYIIFSDDMDSDSYPVWYIDRDGFEVFNEDGDFYLPNYYDSELYSGSYSDLPSKSARKPVYYDTVSSYRYIDLTGREFRSVSNSDDIPSAYNQALNRPVYDPTLASMQSQLEGYKMQLIQAQIQSSQLGTTFTSYLWGGYNHTGEQITSLMEQFSQLKQIKQQDLLRNIKELQTKLSKDSTIVAGFSGTIVSLHINRYDFVQPGAVVGNLVREGLAVENTKVVLYIPLDQGKLVQEGMEVNISPTTVKREEYGYIAGRVKSVSEYAVSPESMMATLRNEQLVRTFGGDTAVMEIEIELLHNTDTVSGYQWSTPKGPPITIDTGTVCAGEIKVSIQRPVDMVMPFIKRLFQ